MYLCIEAVSSKWREKVCMTGEGGGDRSKRGAETKWSRARESPPVTFACQHQTCDHREDVGRGKEVGWAQDLQDVLQDAGKPETRQRACWKHQEARLAVLPAEDGALPYRLVPALDENSFDGPVLVVPVSHADKGSPPQGVPKVERTTEDPLEGGVEGGRKGEAVVEGS